MVSVVFRGSKLLLLFFPYLSVFIRWSTSICYFNNQKIYEAFMKEKSGMIYAHYSLLSLLALFFSRLTEYYWRYLTFRTDPRCWPQPGPGARCPGRWHPPALREEDADVSNLRAGQLMRSMAVCSLPCHRGVQTLVRKGCIIQYFYEFLLYPSVFFTWPNQMDCLISDICGISNVHGQVLRVVEYCFPGPPKQTCLQLSVEDLSGPERSVFNSFQRSSLTGYLIKATNGFIKNNWPSDKCEWKRYYLLNLLR